MLVHSAKALTSLFVFQRIAPYIGDMRFFIVLLSCVFLVSPAVADQTDPGLEALFTELRDGTVIDADETTQRIVDIWSDAASASSDVIYDRAQQAFADENLNLANKLLSYVNNISPQFAQGWVLQAAVLMEIGNREQATKAYLKALELEPRHFIASSQLADILYASGEKREAFDMYQKALQWNPHLPHAKEQAAKLRTELAGQEI